MRTTSLLLLSALFFSGLQSAAQQKTGIHQIASFAIASPGGWDYLIVQPNSSRLYVSHGMQVNILDKKTGDSLGVIPNTIGVHGIAFDTAAGFGYTSNGRGNNVSVFSLKDFHVTAQIPVVFNPDAIFYEPFTKSIVTCNGRSNNLNFLNTDFNRVSDSIAVGGKPETAVSDGKGRLYVNIEDKNEIVAVDLKTKTVAQRFSLAPDEGPTGLVLNTVTNRLYASCDKNLVVLNAATGAVVTRIPIGEGCDGVGFDESAQLIYTSNGEGTLSVIHADGADKYTLLENIPTKKGARTITVDQVTHKIYMPTADFEPADPAKKERPKMIPGTFQVLVFGK